MPFLISKYANVPFDFNGGQDSYKNVIDLDGLEDVMSERWL